MKVKDAGAQELTTHRGIEIIFVVSSKNVVLALCFFLKSRFIYI